jgi:hypothetical protein
MTKSMKAISLAAALCVGLGGVVFAQGLKKYVTPDGKTVYSDTPVPGAKEVGEIKTPPKPDPASRSQAEASARRDAKDVKALDQRFEDRRSQQARIEAAEAKLEKAQRALKEGVEPLPGERTGTAGGKSRLNDAYHQRQRDLQHAVEQAKTAVKEARAAK